jgi:hypothetical protein
VYHHFKVPFLSIENYSLDKTVLDLIPHHLMKEYEFIILERLNHVFTVGMTQPHLKGMIENIIKKHVHPMSVVLLFQIDPDRCHEQLQKIQQGQYNQHEEIKWEG